MYTVSAENGVVAVAEDNFLVDREVSCSVASRNVVVFVVIDEVGMPGEVGENGVVAVVEDNFLEDRDGFSVVSRFVVVFNVATDV